jgi:hypothetical protein
LRRAEELFECYMNNDLSWWFREGYLISKRDL